MISSISKASLTEMQPWFERISWDLKWKSSQDDSFIAAIGDRIVILTSQTFLKETSTTYSGNSELNVCISELNQHWFRQWLVTWLLTSHYLNQCWLIVNYTLKNKLQCKLNQHAFREMHLKMLSVEGSHFAEVSVHCGLVTPYDNIDLGQHWFR